MEVKNKNDGKNGFFFIEENGTEIGVMHYVLASPTRMVIDHTEVNEAHEGKGLGKKLVEAGVDYARKNKMQIQPLCEFAKKMFGVTPGFADVLYKAG